jgi:hypothetical protein
MAFLLALTVLGACGGRVGTDAAADAAVAQDANPTACSWPTSFDPISAEPMRDSCRAARAFLDCQASDGSGVSCVTDKAKCELAAKPGVTYTCTNACKATEFGATCGNAMGSSVKPPADCRAIAVPGGAFYCCACSP